MAVFLTTQCYSRIFKCSKDQERVRNANPCNQNLNLTGTPGNLYGYQIWGGSVQILFPVKLCFRYVYNFHISVFFFFFFWLHHVAWEILATPKWIKPMPLALDHHGSPYISNSYKFFHVSCFLGVPLPIFKVTFFSSYESITCSYRKIRNYK